MAFDTPDPKAIALDIGGEMESGLKLLGKTVDATSGQSGLSVLARSFATGAYNFHLFLQRMSQEMFPQTATFTLPMHGDSKGVYQLEATPARGKVRLTGLTGTSLLALSELRANGIVYVTLADAVIGPDGYADVAIEAVEVGKAGNLAAGAKLGLPTPVAGLDPAATVLADETGAGLSGGEDIEDIEGWRERILEASREPAQGGSRHDYEVWAREIAGVAHVAVYPEQFGLNAPGIFFSVKGADPVPTAEQIARVTAHIADVRPVTARPQVHPIIAQAINVVVEIIPDSLAVRMRVEAAIRAWFYAIHNNPKKDDPWIGQPFYVSRLQEVISAEIGERAHRVLSPPTNTVYVEPTALPVLGTLNVLGAEV